MGRVVVSEFVTLDGVMEDPGGAEHFPHGGWAFKFDRGEEGNKYKVDELMSADALLLGRVTYEGFAAAWPKMDGDEFGKKMNSMPKYVVSSTLSDPSWTNSNVISGEDLGAEVNRLKDEVGELLVAGSAQLAQSLLGAGLVDELRLMVYPTVLGTGKRLFPEGAEPINLDLVYSAPAAQTMLLTYHRAGA
jgi:dihydrofolate reductase